MKISLLSFSGIVVCSTMAYAHLTSNGTDELAHNPLFAKRAVVKNESPKVQAPRSTIQKGWVSWVTGIVFEDYKKEAPPVHTPLLKTPAVSLDEQDKDSNSFLPGLALDSQSLLRREESQIIAIVQPMPLKPQADLLEFKKDPVHNLESPNSKDKITLQELETLDTLNLPKAMANALIYGLNRQESLIIHRIGKKDASVSSKYQHPTNLEAARRNAAHLRKRDQEWPRIIKLRQKTKSSKSMRSRIDGFFYMKPVNSPLLVR